VSLWSGDQDAPKRSHREGRAKSGAWGQVAIGTGVTGLRRFRETQHVVCRTIESHDPTGLSVSRQTHDLSSSAEATPQRSPGIASLPLQFRQASPGTEIRTYGQDAGHASWSDPTTTDIKGNLLFEDGFSGAEECQIRALRLDPVRQRRCLANASGGLATIDDGSTPHDQDMACRSRHERAWLVLAGARIES